MSAAAETEWEVPEAQRSGPRRSRPHSSGLDAAILGFIFGMQYDTRAPGRCYDTMEMTFIEVDEIASLLLLFWMPINYGDFGIATKDLTDIIAALA